jgi:hypothetical protein
VTAEDREPVRSAPCTSHATPLTDLPQMTFREVELAAALSRDPVALVEAQPVHRFASARHRRDIMAFALWLRDRG